MKHLVLLLALVTPQSAEVEFASEFIPVAVRAMVAIRRGDRPAVQRAVAAGRLANFDRRLTSPLGSATMTLPDCEGSMTFREIWQRIQEYVEPRLEFSTWKKRGRQACGSTARV